MDNERRHQLQQNELADQLDKAKTWIEPYVVPILVGVIAITLVGIVVNFVQSQRSSGRSEATLDLLFSTAVGPSGEEDPEVLDRVAKNFAGTTQAQMALISKADIYLAQGIEALFTDRSEAETLLKDAESAYEQVLETTDVSLLKSRAQFGLAQTLESQGKVDEAIAAFEKLAQMNESEGMTEVAESRIAMLKRPETQAFAAWFAEQKPQAFDPATPPGLPGMDQIPGMPSIQLPGMEPVTGDDGATGTSGSTSPLSDLLNGAMNSSDKPVEDNPAIQLPSETTSEDSPAPAEPAEPAVEETTPDAPASDGAPAEEPAAEEPKPEAPTADTPAPEQPTESPAAETPAEQPASEPAGEPAPAEEPATEPAPAEQPPAEDPAVTEQPAPQPETGDGGSADGGSADGGEPSSGENQQP